MESSNKIIDLRSLLQGDGKNIHVSADIVARLDVAGGPLIIAGSFINEGSVEIIGNEHASALLQAKSIVNKGEIKSALKRLMIGAGSLENSGSIGGSKTLELIGIAGPLKVLGTGGSFAAQEAVIVNAKFGINVAGGNFSAPAIDFNADEGIAQISAEALNGKVNIKSKSQANNQARVLPALLAGPHVYYNNGAGVSLGSDVSHGSDEVIIVSTHDITIDGSITCGKLTLAAGVLFKIDGNYPPSGQVNDSNSSCLIESAQGAASITVNGDLNTSDDVLVKAWTFEVFADSISIDGKLTTGANTRLDGTSSVHIEEEILTLREANILLFSDGPVGTGAITIDNSTASIAGRLGVKAYRAGGSSEFIIGGTNNSNGINGPIVVDTVSGGGNDPSTYWYGGVYISNGGSGGIKVTAATNISVKGTKSKSGGIILDAHDGTIKLPAGTLSADGTGNYPGAVIHLLAETINTENGTIISATDNGTGQTQKAVQIAAKTINLQGANGLTIKADGGGNQTYPDNVTVVPKGSITVSDNDSVTFFSIFAWLSNGTFNNEGEVAFAGSGSAPLKLTSNGSHSRVELSGYPLKFAGGPVTVESKGAENHEINILYYGATSGANGLQFNGGDVTLDASGTASGNGDAGKITLGIDKTVRSALGKVVMRANGHGNGKGGQISFNPGGVDIKIGGSNEEYSFSAKGGDTDGDGGKIDIQGYSSSISVKGATSTATVLDVSVPGSTGNGGEINIVAYGTSGLSFDATEPSYLRADGGSASGNGGKITIVTSNVPLTVGSGDGELTLSAVANDGDGAGGTIDITSWSGLDVSSASVDVSADGNGDGGIIKLSAGYSTLSLSGSISADGGSSNGDGGKVEIQGGEISIGTLALQALTPSQNAITANGNGTGNGGEITILAQWGPLEIKDEVGFMKVQAKSTDAGDGGLLMLVANSTTQNLSVDGVAVNLSAGPTGNGKGGEFTAICPSGKITVKGTLSIDGAGSGDGGTIGLDAGKDVVLPTGTILTVDAGSSGGNGGLIDIKAGQTFIPTGASPNQSASLSASAKGADGEGGQIVITSATTVGVALETANIFTATGHGSGKGGYVEINKVSLIDIPSVINVDAGSSAGTSVQFGLISLNGVPVAQWKTSNNTWPKTYWTATSGYANPQTRDKAHSTMALHSNFDNLRALFSNTKRVHIFLFPSSTVFNQFWSGGSEVATAGGLTFKTGNTIFCCPWQSGSIGLNSAVTYNADQIMQVTAHELGHAADLLFDNGTLISNTSYYNGKVTNDITDLNSPAPCAGPFVDVVSLAHGYVCAGGSLTSYFSAMYPNYAILEDLNPPTFAGGPNLIELHAQVFGYVATAGLARGANPQFDKVLANGAFARLQAWATTMLSGTKP